jgi:hypothetical protein
LTEHRRTSRARQLIEAQSNIVLDYERRGWNSRPARRLLSTMYRSFRLMLEHHNRLREEFGMPLASHNGLPWPLARTRVLRPPPHLEV